MITFSLFIRYFIRYVFLIFLILWHGAFAKEDIAAGNFYDLNTVTQSSAFESGYLQTSKQDNLFYLLVRAKVSNAPLIIYLAGGPGASSIAPAFVQNGPWRLIKPFHHDTDYRLVANAWSWNNLANVVYLDQPRYVGYSYGTGNYLTSLHTTGHDFLTALLLFYQRYPEFQQRPLYLAGESFGGAYVGEYAHQILQYNKQHPKSSIHLSGLFIESGVIAQNLKSISPYYQLDFLCTQNMLPDSACLPYQYDNFYGILNQCVNAIVSKKHIPPAQVNISDVDAAAKSIAICGKYISAIQTPYKTKPYRLPDTSSFPPQLRGKTIQEPADSLQFSDNSIIRQFLNYSPNPYNVELTCQSSDYFPAWCYDGYKLMQFFNNPLVKRWLGNGMIPNQVEWKFAQFPVAVAMVALNQSLPPLESYYAEALRNNIKVTIIYGKSDWIMNYFAEQVIVNRISNLAYGQLLFDQLPAPVATFNKLIVRGKQVGEYKTLQGFTFAQVDHAGHMIALDQPQAMYQLLYTLVKGSGKS